ncbi:CBO0543 family protein [Paenibacillus sp. FSL K6-1217]|uniref:CBO0543 family protein n=1 Tax=Paenibacillus sp. FSL K6-1217 TaxID=2921466 RepID=UPI003248E89B
MVVNVIIGWVLPWLVGSFFIRKDKFVFLHIGPFASVIAFIFDEIGHHMRWWSITPAGAGILAFIPYNLGVFPVISCLLLYTVRRSSVNPWLLIPLFSTGKTMFELSLVLAGKVTYDRGWNIGWTYVSYVLACSLCYGWYRCFWSRGINQGN